MSDAPIHKLAGKCAADCGGVLDRGDALYWIVGIALLAITAAGVVARLLRQRR